MLNIHFVFNFAEFNEDNEYDDSPEEDEYNDDEETNMLNGEEGQKTNCEKYHFPFGWPIFALDKMNRSVFKSKKVKFPVELVRFCAKYNS